MMEDKILFLKEEFVPLLRQLQPTTQPVWGKMDAQQMVEHLKLQNIQDQKSQR